MLVNHLASFQAIQLASKPFSQLSNRFNLVSKRDHSTLYNWKQPNQLKMTSLQTGQIYKPKAITSWTARKLAEWSTETYKQGIRPTIETQPILVQTALILKAIHTGVGETNK